MGELSTASVCNQEFLQSWLQERKAASMVANAQELLQPVWQPFRQASGH